MKALMGLVTALSFPLTLLNILGGITSGIWLAVLRDWGTLGLGLGFFFFSTLILGFVLTPSLLLAAPAAYYAEKGKTLGLIFFGTLSSLYVVALITVWCCGVLFLFVRDASAATIIPRLIWSYGVATGPWGYMASKDRGSSDEGVGSTFAVFMAELAYLVIMLVVIFFGISLIGALKVFGAFMLVALVAQITTVVLIQRQRFAEQQAFGE
jgi:hypothetical protein